MDQISLAPILHTSHHICSGILTRETFMFNCLRSGMHCITCTLPSEIFRLCFQSGNISVCNGYRNKFDKKAKPPDDLCVQHEEWCSYTSPVSRLPVSRLRNAYYHAKPCCIIATFTPSDIIITDEIMSRLLPEHKTVLFILFGVVV